MRSWEGYGFWTCYNQSMQEKYIRARNLRNNMTEQEKKLWYYLRKRFINNYRFRRQYPIGNYVVDFICREKNLIIELDGGQHNEEQAIIYDKERAEYLESRGFRVIRFWNNDIDTNIEAVLGEIVKYLD